MNNTLTFKDRGVLEEGEDELEGVIKPVEEPIPVHVEEILKFQVDSYDDTRLFKPRKATKKRKVDESDTLDMKMTLPVEHDEEDYYDRLMKMRPVPPPVRQPVESRQDDFKTAWLSRISKPRPVGDADAADEVALPTDEEVPADIDMKTIQDDDEGGETDQVGEAVVDSDLNAMREAPLDEGAASFLSMIRARGMLKDKKHRDDTDDVRLEYRDEFGRSLGPKEAYKQLSWAFHGKKPGKKKQEKRLMVVQNERRVLALDSHEKVTTLQALHSTAESEQKPYLVLSDNKGINP